MGEPLGFAYVSKEKSLPVKRHEFRLCLITGIQPANANVILDDADSGTPARYLWLPTSDPALLSSDLNRHGFDAAPF